MELTAVSLPTSTGAVWLFPAARREVTEVGCAIVRHLESLLASDYMQSAFGTS